MGFIDDNNQAVSPKIEQNKAKSATDVEVQQLVDNWINFSISIN